jgi:inorganic pyrophosphatase
LGIIEIQQGSKAKYEIDKVTGFLMLDRILSSHLHYPFYYGFIPQTYCEDKDPLDILILCREKLVPLSIVESTVVGIVRMIDDGAQDDKIIAVPTRDPGMNHIRNLNDISQDEQNSIRTFFQEYKKPDAIHVEVQEMQDREHAYAVILESIKKYKSLFAV